MLPLLQAALLGVVQGLTEFLPVSSTAHLLIGARMLGFLDPDGVFTVMIQLGSIVAIMWLYRSKIVEVVAGLPSKPDARYFALTIIVAVAPALLAGYLLSDYVTRVLFRSLPVIATAFILGGVVMLMLERFRPTPTVRDMNRVPLGRAAGIGVFQVLALIPGVSRSGATIIGGLLMGLERPVAAEFSFFLAMPTMSAAFAHSLLEVKDRIAPHHIAEIVIGFVTAFLAALVVVKPFLGFVTRSGFAPFAWYRIVAGAAILAAIAGGWV